MKELTDDQVTDDCMRESNKDTGGRRKDDKFRGKGEEGGETNVGRRDYS